ncbi:hypothetical protein WOLCODRAFT_110034 [Wolfiporia cocos MD-104 SS10]|uniref:Protein-S-isoprenylcysteine O-methyltransferase n=1 Tax=Wolfiporia cocos (strain MD-104) TaxID=742152 RepID=A0A2H3JNE3_WOLCO|nr:hypothetical protein WOLCODRAFT_110034 [Wolfiporia cocos MD-104 SS10]
MAMLSTHSLALHKIPLLILGAIGGHISVLELQTSTDAKERQKYGKDDFVTIARHYLVMKYKVVLWATAISETLVLLAANLPSSLSQRVLEFLTSNGVDSASRVQVTPAFLVGFSFVVFCGITRLVCFRTLGRHFTYSLTVRENHKLITSGPYSVVRHPAYTASVVGNIGMALVHLGSGSWWATSGALETLTGRVFAIIWLTTLVTVSISLIARTQKEDRVLKQEFGPQWDKWAGQTPYRLVPGVY